MREWKKEEKMGTKDRDRKKRRSFEKFDTHKIRRVNYG